MFTFDLKKRKCEIPGLLFTGKINHHLNNKLFVRCNHFMYFKLTLKEVKQIKRKLLSPPLQLIYLLYYQIKVTRH